MTGCDCCDGGTITNDLGGGECEVLPCPVCRPEAARWDRLTVEEQKAEAFDVNGGVYS